MSIILGLYKQLKLRGQMHFLYMISGKQEECKGGLTTNAIRMAEAA